MNFTATIANALWLGSNAPAAVRFRRALSHPAETQWHWLRDRVARNTDTAFGKAHGFARIRTYPDFVRQVPIRDHEALAPWIERIRNGESRVLTIDPVRRLVPTSGSSGARKLIPFTDGLQQDFNGAIDPWIADLYRQRPGVAFGRAYWSVSPAVEINDEKSAVPIGFDDDADYLGGVRKRLVEAVMTVPSAIRSVSDMEQFRYLTLLCLLRCGDLRLVSVWHPSFFTLLLDAAPGFWGSLTRDLADGTCRDAKSVGPVVLQALKLRPMPWRAKQLDAIGPASPGKWWPALRVISCWADGHAALAKADLERRFRGVLVQPKGLIATEGIVTIPYSRRHPLAIGSHFFEFIGPDGDVVRAHELKAQETYEVILTTSGGLWRYRLGDRVSVTGFAGKTPSLRFVGRAGNLSDRFGEKLSEPFVAGVIRSMTTDADPRFALLAPDDGPSGCCYTFYYEGAAAVTAERLDTLLCENPHYAWCRQLGQLRSARLFRIRDGGYAAFAARQVARGMRLGDIKPSALSEETGWSERFSGHYEN